MIWGPLIALMLSQEPSDLRCTLRVSANGVYVDGDPMTNKQAIAKCKHTKGGAIVIVADDAPTQAWPALRRELERQHIKIYLRGALDDRRCVDNPLAKGCD